MQEIVALNAKEQKRLKTLNMVERGDLKMKEAGKVMGLSVRQVRRLRVSYRVEGAAGLAYGNRGDGHTMRLMLL